VADLKIATTRQTPKALGRLNQKDSGDEEGFGIFLGDGEELESGLAGAAGALFPTARRESRGQ
jgi:hypothetical protein